MFVTLESVTARDVFDDTLAAPHAGASASVVTDLEDVDSLDSNTKDVLQVSDLSHEPVDLVSAPTLTVSGFAIAMVAQVRQTVDNDAKSTNGAGAEVGVEDISVFIGA